MNLSEQVIDFVNDPDTKSAWLGPNSCNIFVRNSVQLSAGKRSLSLDLANGTILEPMHKDLSVFMDEVEKAIGAKRIIFVENLLDTDTIQFFRDRRYSENRRVGGYVSFARLPEGV